MSPVLLIAISAWAVAQGLKLLIAAAVYRKFDITYLTTGGGMPSSHSALVCAAAVSCGMSAGFDSPVFAVDELKELIGHTPFQVAMGAVLGVAVGLAGSFIAFGV